MSILPRRLALFRNRPDTEALEERVTALQGRSTTTNPCSPAAALTGAS